MIAMTAPKTAQIDQILECLESGKSLSSLQALNAYGCFRLAARIKDLRQLGWEVTTEMIDGHAVYSLAD